MNVTVLLEVLSWDGDTAIRGVYEDKLAAEAKAAEENAKLPNAPITNWLTETHDVIPANAGSHRQEEG